MAFFPGLSTFFLSYCIQYCCSLKTILYLILIFLILSFILSGVLIFYIKQFLAIHFVMIIGIILINMDFIVLIIFSCLSIFKYFNFNNTDIEITQEKKKLLNKFSIIFALLSILNILLSVACCCSCYKEGERQELKLRIHSLLPVVILIMISCICLISFLFWHSLHDFKGKIHGNENCCNCCCCGISNDNNKTNNNIIITIHNESNNIFISHTNVNKPEGTIKEEEKKDSKKLICDIDVHFIMTTGQTFLIKAPSIITIEQFFNFFFEILKIKKSDRTNVAFINGAQPLDKNSNILLGNKLKSDIPLLVIDQGGIIQPTEKIFIYE